MTIIIHAFAISNLIYGQLINSRSPFFTLQEEREQRRRKNK